MNIELREEEVSRLADLILYEHSDFYRDHSALDTEILHKFNNLLTQPIAKEILS
jgi:hypothetical protein